MGELFAALYDPLIAPLDSLGVRNWRRWATSAAQGRVLEIGIGTGLNLPHYPPIQSLAAVDPNGASLRRALGRRNGKGEAIGLYQARAEHLPFPESSFDVVLGTLVFCTISEPTIALSEVRRVLKPGGTLRLVEHVRLPNSLAGGVQDLVTPLWQHIAGGCHLNRDTLASVRQAGFRVRAARSQLGGLFVGIDAER